MSTEKITIKDIKFDDKGIDWLRGYKEFQENILYQRANMSVLVSAILTTIFATIFIKVEKTDTIMKYSICGFGLLVTVILFLSLHRQSKILTCLRDLLKGKDASVYAEWRKYHEGKCKSIISGRVLIVYCLPAAFLVFWIGGIFYCLLDLS